MEKKIRRKECLATKNCRKLSSLQVTRHIRADILCETVSQQRKSKMLVQTTFGHYKQRKFKGIKKSGRGRAIKTAMRSGVVRILHQGDDDTDDNGLCRHNVHYKAGSPHCLIIHSSNCFCFHFVEVNLLCTVLPAVTAAQP